LARSPESSSQPQKVADHYVSGYEAHRLETGTGRLERERLRELLTHFLPTVPATLLDVGGGTGPYACWLAKLGYTVHLVDLVPLHVELAQPASAAQPEAPLASAAVGDACGLPSADEHVDELLMFGLLYHVIDRHDRLQALKEAHRVGIELIKVLIVCYSTSGHVYRMARLVAEGVADVPGAEPVIRTVQELIPEAIIDAWDEMKASKAMQQGSPMVTLKDFRYVAWERRCAAPLPRQRASKASHDGEISRR
jgi:ubiquinone/menaquinone biosynthesis C-methylase UbiE